MLKNLKGAYVYWVVFLIPIILLFTVIYPVAVILSLFYSVFN